MSDNIDNLEEKIQVDEVIDRYVAFSNKVIQMEREKVFKSSNKKLLEIYNAICDIINNNDSISELLERKIRPSDFSFHPVKDYDLLSIQENNIREIGLRKKEYYEIKLESEDYEEEYESKFNFKKFLELKIPWKKSLLDFSKVGEDNEFIDTNSTIFDSKKYQIPNIFIELNDDNKIHAMSSIPKRISYGNGYRIGYFEFWIIPKYSPNERSVDEFISLIPKDAFSKILSLIEDNEDIKKLYIDYMKVYKSDDFKWNFVKKEVINSLSKLSAVLDNNMKLSLSISREDMGLGDIVKRNIIDMNVDDLEVKHPIYPLRRCKDINKENAPIYLNYLKYYTSTLSVSNLITDDLEELKEKINNARVERQKNLVLEKLNNSKDSTKYLEDKRKKIINEYIEKRDKFIDAKKEFEKYVYDMGIDISSLDKEITSVPKILVDKEVLCSWDENNKCFSINKEFKSKESLQFLEFPLDLKNVDMKNLDLSKSKIEFSQLKDIKDRDLSGVIMDNNSMLLRPFIDYSGFNLENASMYSDGIIHLKGARVNIKTIESLNKNYIEYALNGVITDQETIDFINLNRDNYNFENSIHVKKVGSDGLTEDVILFPEFSESLNKGGKTL